ncbi:hypothetical protein M9H77_02777 [Catharanthus roseus]|uniref:Uncharacterized protein n=1 Tax=Catharanthus roseus TaxID=4058 RepID=A0ACC0C9H7_CATRO|nr:hypothetical protein M9H77_02777 [Catharanthus roseus]
MKTATEKSKSQHDDPLRFIMQELQSLRDEMRDIRRDVTNLSNQQREVSPHGSLNVTTPRSNGPFNCSRTTEFHQPPHFDEELHLPPYGGRKGAFAGRGMPRDFEEVPRPQARHGEPLYDDHEHRQRITLYVASPPYEGLFRWPGRFRLGRVDPLEEGRRPRRVWPNRSTQDRQRHDKSLKFWAWNLGPYLSRRTCLCFGCHNELVYCPRVALSFLGLIG